MKKKKRIAVIIPAYNVGKKINLTIKKIPNYVEKIFVIDDCCPLNTANYVKKSNRIIVIKNKKNLGVGGAVKIGFLKCLKFKYNIIFKIDGDGQMNPVEMKKFLDKIELNKYNYCKGNRFLENLNVENYPTVRFYGNIILSFISKLSTGYWDIYDPINGFFCITSETLKKINIKDLDNRYFFETDILFQLYLIKAKVKDIPVKIKYVKNEKQNMSIFKESFNFFFKNIHRIYKRIILSYFNNNFTVNSFFIFFSLIFLSFSTIYGGYNWYKFSFLLNTAAPTGIIMFSSISTIAGIIFSATSLVLDSQNNPNKI